MKPPEDAIYIIRHLNKAGYEAYLVGGCVRDMIMGKPPGDWDITTSAPPEAVKGLFPKTFDTGIRHGTVTVVLGKRNYEVTTYRVDGAYTDFRRPDEVRFTSSLKEDLTRRDFTMNAMAYHPEEGLVDYFGGKVDIEKRLIRGVGDPLKRFREDALRMMRAVRFACQLGFHIEEETFQALKSESGLVRHVSIERIRDEFLKALTSAHPEGAVYFTRCDLLYDGLPFMADYLRAHFQGFLTNLYILADGEKTNVNVMGLLLKDMDEKKVPDALKRMKMDNASIKNVTAIVPLINAPLEAQPLQVKKILCAIGQENYFNLLTVKKACGEIVAGLQAEGMRILSSGEPVFLKDLSIDGNILMTELGVEGRATGDLLRYLHGWVLKHPEDNRSDTLLELARVYLG